jgi:SAM-dependent methyltransferase
LETDIDSAKDAWRAFQDRWPRLKPPLRPGPDVVAAIGRAIDGHSARVLQLGVTPELNTLGDDLTAVDWSAEMIAGVWPGDTPSRRALLADWRAMPPAAAPYTAVIGDGSLNALAWADVAPVLAAVAERLTPGGRLALRCYVSPDAAEDLEALAEVALSAREPSPHAFKWRLAMALRGASGDPDVALAAIWDAFDRLLPNRAALARASGWSAADIGDFEPYRGNPTTFCFPTASELRAALPASLGRAVFAPSGAYPLAERCPILVAEKLA